TEQEVPNQADCIVSLVGALETSAPPARTAPLARNVKDVNIIKTKYLIYIFFTKNAYFCRTNGSVLTILSIL
ncbi:MAG: hypothetical protein MR989_07360, partial [Prevotella sp.]|nr:hypothetical protein [Prevotella sp.]